MIVATKTIKFPTIQVTIKKIANIIAATNAGHFSIFCNAIEIIIVAIGKAKNISKVFIILLLFNLLSMFCLSPHINSMFTIFYAYHIFLLRIVTT